MNCYEHDDRVAVGICKNCGRALCPACAIDVGDGLACKGRCEDRVRLVNRIVDNNQRVLASANAQVRSSGWLLVALGLVFMGAGFLPYALNRYTGTLLGFLGMMFAAFGLTRFRRRMLYPNE